MKEIEKVMSFKNDCWPKMEQKDCVGIGKFPVFSAKYQEGGRRLHMGYPEKGMLISHRPLALRVYSPPLAVSLSDFLCSHLRTMNVVTRIGSGF